MFHFIVKRRLFIFFWVVKLQSHLLLKVLQWADGNLKQALGSNFARIYFTGSTLKLQNPSASLHRVIPHSPGGAHLQQAHNRVIPHSLA